ncbi:MAG TPA: hypothetical protein VN963_00340 [bacterium]|nr:hypothetical protein [bacterium]
MTSYLAVPEPSDRIPEGELTGILKSVDSVLQSWANLSSQHIGMPAEGPAPLPLEFSIRFSFPSSVFLNVRTTGEMAQVMIRSIRGQAVFPISDEEVFREFVNLLSDRLMAYLWGNHRRPFKSNEQFFSAPRNWPLGEPTACGAFIVENFPIEVRLWAECKIGERR